MEVEWTSERAEEEEEERQEERLNASIHLELSAVGVVVVCVAGLWGGLINQIPTEWVEKEEEDA